MPIENDAELVTAVREASRLIQEISDYANDHPVASSLAKIRFPAGVLRTTAHHRRKLAFVEDDRLRKNLSYAIMTHDVLRWMVTRTTIGLQARDMLIKEAICIIGSVSESITIWRGELGLGKGKSFGDRLIRLRELGIIDEKAETDLNWVWEIRCREHLAGVEIQEWNHYTMDHWRRSVGAFSVLREGLARWRDAQVG
jgi:hypothetical protein